MLVINPSVLHCKFSSVLFCISYNTEQCGTLCVDATASGIMVVRVQHFSASLIV